MIRVAISGNIASGKSEVEKILSNIGYKVLDTDKIAHDLLENNQEIINAFKDFDIMENNKISREKLGKIVFSNSEMKSILEDILHPQIKVEIEKFFNLYALEKYVFVSIPLLFEAKMDDMFDKIIFVYADDEIRLKRLIARNGYSKDYALKRMNSQISQNEKVAKSDFIIKNNSSLESLKEQITICLYQL